jgi:hypothetical protein
MISLCLPLDVGCECLRLLSVTFVMHRHRSRRLVSAVMGMYHSSPPSSFLISHRADHEFVLGPSMMRISDCAEVHRRPSYPGDPAGG